MPHQKIPETAVVIVNHNAGALLEQCVQCALASTAPVALWVVDNASSDTSLTALTARCGTEPRLHVLNNRENIGFARAVNQALAGIENPYVLLLNPDCLLQTDTVARLIEALQAHATAGMVGPLIRNADGSEQPGCRRRAPTPWRTLMQLLPLSRWFPNRTQWQGYLMTGEPLPREPTPVEAISGALMLVRRAALAAVGPLDEGYFMHCEDLDWCRRFRHVGWTILFVPDVAVVHHKGTCSRARPVFVSWHKHRGMLRYCRKHLSNAYAWPLLWATYLAIGARFIVTLPKALRHTFPSR